MSGTIQIEPSKESSQQTEAGVLRTLWGYAFSDEVPRAVYYVRFNDTKLEELLLVASIGEWGEGASPSERRCVACLARAPEGKLAFMLVDAAKTSFSDQEFLGEMCSAESVRGTPLADEAFHILDHIILEDARVAEVRARLEG